jgi:hypothetical protein
MQQLAVQAAKASWRAGIARLGIDYALVMHGTNDQLSRTPAQVAADGLTVGTGIKAAVAASDVAFFWPPENQLGRSTKMKDITAAGAEMCALNNYGFYDHQDNFGDPDNPNEYGSDGINPLFNVDKTHPEPSTGGRVLLDAYFRFFNQA